MNATPRPRELPGRTVKARVTCGTLYLTINYNPESGQEFELFGRIGKAGGCGRALMEGLHRLASLALRLGASKEDIIHHLEQIRCNVGGQPTKHASCVDAIATILGEPGVNP